MTGAFYHVAVFPFALIQLSEFAQHYLNQVCVWCGVLPRLRDLAQRPLPGS